MNIENKIRDILIQNIKKNDTYIHYINYVIEDEHMLCKFEDTLTSKIFYTFTRFSDNKTQIRVYDSKTNNHIKDSLFMSIDEIILNKDILTNVDLYCFLLTEFE